MYDSNPKAPFEFSLSIHLPQAIRFAHSVSILIHHPPSFQADLEPLDQIISIDGIHAFIIIGLLDHERLERQKVSIDLKISIKPSTQVDHDRPDIQALTRFIFNKVEQTKFFTVEALAGWIAEQVLSFQDNRVQKIIRRARVTVSKPEAISRASGAGVEIVRSLQD